MRMTKGFRMWSFLNLWRRGRREPRRGASMGRVCRPINPSGLLNLEQLEDRLVPTIVFNPYWGPEQLVAGSQSHAVRSPSVDLLFWGSYWGTNQGKTDEQRVALSVNSLVNSPYLTGLTEYGSDGKATIGKIRFDYSDPTISGFDWGISDAQVQAEIDAKIYNPTDQKPIYILITAPGSPRFDANFISGGGYNDLDTNHRYLYAAMPAVSDTPGGPISIDPVTWTLSHELVEAMSRGTDNTGVSVNPPNNSPYQNAGVGQICDYEGGNYWYRLGGVKLAPYWSDAHQAWIVPDGNQQTLQLYPNWDGNTFLNTYAVNIYGGQSGSGVDNAVLSTSAAGGLQVVLNNQVFTFDPNAINKAWYAAANQTYLSVPSLPGSVTLSTTSLISSSTNITVGSASSSLANVVGTVDVSNVTDPGQTVLTVDDSQDTSSYANLGITNNTVKYNGQAVINYYGAQPGSNGALHGVTSLDLDGGSGIGDSYTINSTAAHTPVSIQTGPGSNYVYVYGSSSPVSIEGNIQAASNDHVEVGANGSLVGITGPVSVSNPSGQTTLEINDANDPNGGTVTVTDHSVAFAGLTTINYTSADKNGQGVAELEVDGSAHGQNVFDVESVSPYVNIDLWLNRNDYGYGAAWWDQNVHVHLR
ncbi:MAG: hypothetical protein JO112_09945 [Planctomycetes bacterium]|nr:hypothetical protein [Planctomycetota bacterium]